MPDLFAKSEAANLEQVQPLAARMRPRSLAEFVGQQHFLGEGKLLWRMLQARRLGFGDLLRPAGHRQDDARPTAGSGDRQPLSPTQRRHQRREGRPRNPGGGPRRSGGRRPAHAAHDRRDSPLQSRPAGRFIAGRGGRRRDPRRPHHGQSVLRRERRPGEPQPRVRVSAAVGRRHQNARPPRARRQRPRPWPIRGDDRRRCARHSWPKSPTATPAAH